MKELNKLTKDEFEYLKKENVLKHLYPDAPDYYEILKNNIKFKDLKELNINVIKEVFDYLISYIIENNEYLDYDNLKYLLNNLILLFYDEKTYNIIKDISDKKDNKNDNIILDNIYNNITKKK